MTAPESEETRPYHRWISASLDTGMGRYMSIWFNLIRKNLPPSHTALHRWRGDGRWPKRQLHCSILCPAMFPRFIDLGGFLVISNQTTIESNHRIKPQNQATTSHLTPPAHPSFGYEAKASAKLSRLLRQEAPERWMLLSWENHGKST